MNLDLVRRPLLALLLAAGASLAGGCAVAADEGDDEFEASTDAITDVNHSSVKRQSIGNCWLYATASWAESLNKSATRGNAEMNMSESYWTYWHWFDQIANGSASREISTGGWYATAAEIINRYGIVAEGSFIPSEANDEMSLRQKTALDKINASIKSGALSTPEARRDRALVRRELDTAWELSSNVRSQITRVFGASVSRTLDRSTVSTSFTSIRRASSIRVELRDPQTRQPVTATLQDALGTRTTSWGPREGRFAWQMTSYPTSAAARRNTLIRVQKAMHDRQPVIMSWFVDFNALDPQGRFAAPPATPGRQGGHMVVVEDYQINDVPGFGTLKVGQLETRPEALEAALSPAAKIELIRVKNSWGSFRPDRQFVLPGYHDLYMKYLDGPVKRCSENADGTTNTNNCYDDTPLNDFVLPPGY
ncbi:MAG: hypothetical protein KF819_10955 [Labilithrix sp.]|nr:hypothetical protein [Labilithrix sp.]